MDSHILASVDRTSRLPQPPTPMCWRGPRNSRASPCDNHCSNNSIRSIAGRSFSPPSQLRDRKHGSRVQGDSLDTADVRIHSHVPHDHHSTGHFCLRGNMASVPPSLETELMWLGLAKPSIIGPDRTDHDQRRLITDDQQWPLTVCRLLAVNHEKRISPVPRGPQERA